jgi:hypothetical protein
MLPAGDAALVNDREKVGKRTIESMQARNGLSSANGTEANSEPWWLVAPASALSESRPLRALGCC